MGNRNDCMNFYYIFIQMFNKSHFMKKRLLCIPLWGVLSLFILSSCRTEDNIIQQEKDLRFATFVPKAGEKVDYANGFAFLIKRYDEINNTNFSGYNNSILKGNSSQIPLSGEYINFDLHSQLLEQEDGEKWMMYAKISKDKIIDIMVATLKDKETKVGLFSLQKVDKEYYNEVLPAFNAVWLRIQSKNLHLVAGTKNNLNLIAAKDDDNGSCPPGERCKDIPGVVVKGGGKKNKTKDESDYNWQNPCPLLMNCNDGSGGSSGGGGGVGGNSGAPSKEQVEEKIKDEPFAFLDAPCDVVKKWLATAKFTPAQAQLDKLKTIVDISSSNSSVTPGGITIQRIASLQKIDNAYSPTVNMDYFPITINQLPVIDGVRLTPEQFLNHIRTNINNFVDNSYSEFAPYNNYGVDDRGLWNSSNPLGAIIKIDIKGPDNGSVIVTNYRSDKWTFSTIYEPKYKTHPVSGNRDFGFTQNTNGSYTFYTRGVDRLTTIDATTVQNSEFLSYMMGGSPFSQADALWTSFQNKINSFVNSHQGSSSVASQEIYRPDWAKVKAVIEGKAPLSSLSKDCGK